ncbi:MAG TPA: protein kinase [Polyangiales bacterium]|nr:protein kinase [Polyangiales bacterium]
MYFGKYELLSRINIGGMAEIVRARNTRDANRIVAIKRILPHLCGDEHYRAMFMDESRLLAQLNHPSIVRALETGEIDSTPYIALEYVQGQDAREVFTACERAGQPLPLGIACYVMARVCEGLQFVHDRNDDQGKSLGIVHRDVSLQNLLLGYDGEVKVTDFGIAVSEVNEVRTEAGIVKGKFGYMSPEQIRGSKLDRRTDVFATGICLYELLTGERLFSGENDYKAIERVRQADVPRPSSRNRQIPSSLENIVRKALAKNPRDRYPSANDLRRALQGFLAESNLFIERADLGKYLQALFEKEYLAAKRVEAAEQAEWSSQGNETSRQAVPVADLFDAAEQTIVVDSIATTEDSEPNATFTAPSDEPTGLLAFDALPKPEINSVVSDTDKSDTPTPTPVTQEREPRAAIPEGPSQFDMEWDEQEPTTISKDINRVARLVAPAAIGRSQQEPEPEPPPPTAQEAPRSARSRRQRSMPTLELRRPREPRALTVALACAVAGVGVFLLVYLLNDRGEAGIRIDTEPVDSVVLIDGHRLPGEHSPFVVAKLSSRERHTIVVEHTGYQSWSTTLKLPAGEIFPLPTVRLDAIKPSAAAKVADVAPKMEATPPPDPGELEPVAEAEAPRPQPRPKRVSAPAAKAATTVKPTPATKPATVSKPPSSAPAAASKTQAAAKAGGGVLRINTRPWSKVSVDGAPAGNTPQMNIKISAGTHTITLENPEFGIKQKLTLSVKPGETVTRVLTLKP